MSLSSSWTYKGLMGNCFPKCYSNAFFACHIRRIENLGAGLAFDVLGTSFLTNAETNWTSNLCVPLAFLTPHPQLTAFRVA